MDNQTFAASLIDLRNSTPESIIKQFNKLFLEISRMDTAEVTAAFQTVKLTAESTGMENDPALRAVISALHHRMIAITNNAGLGSSRIALYFCSLLQINVKFSSYAEEELVKYRT